MKIRKWKKLIFTCYKLYMKSGIHKYVFAYFFYIKKSKILLFKKLNKNEN